MKKKKKPLKAMNMINLDYLICNLKTESEEELK